MRIARFLVSTCCALTLALLPGCGGGAGPTTETVAELAEGTLGPSGGTLALSDGATLSVAPGVLPDATSVTLARIGNARLANAETQTVYELGGLVPGPGIRLSLRVAPALDPETVGVFQYDPESGEGSLLDATYDAVSGAVSGETRTRVTPRALLRAALAERVRYLLEWDAAYTPTASERLVRMPYYEQVGGSCWAADTIMLARGHRTEEPGEMLYEPLAFCGVEDADWGIGLWTFEELLPRYLAANVGAGTEWRGYVRGKNLLSRILRELDLGHPLILRMPAHAVLIVGYRRTPTGYEVVLHDSKGVSPPDPYDGCMYTTRPFSWITGQAWTAAMQVLWTTAAPAEARTLLTIGLPSLTDTTPTWSRGRCEFVGLTPRGVNGPIAQLRFRPSEGTPYHGYRWEFDEAPTDIPNTAREWALELPIWNAGEQPAEAVAEVTVRDDAGLVYTWTSPPLTVPAAAAPVMVAALIPLVDVRHSERGDAAGHHVVDLVVRLLEGGAYRDGIFHVRAPLSVVPRLDDLAPSAGPVGTTVALSGFAFGKTQPPRGAVRFGGRSAPIVAWADDSITVTVPEGAESGPVTVQTGGRHTYESAAKVFTVQETGDGPPVVLGFTGPDRADDTLAEFPFAVEVGGGVPPYHFVWSARGNLLVEGDGPGFAAVRLTPDQLAQGWNGEAHWIDVAVTDAAGQQAAWLDDGNVPHTQFYYALGYGGFTLSPTYPYRQP